MIDQKLSKLRGLNLDEFEIFWDIYTTLCPRHFGIKPLCEGSETSHSERIYIADVQRRGFSLIDQKLLKLRGLNLDEFEIFWDIFTPLCPRHFGMKPLFYGSNTSHSERIYIAVVQR